MCWAQSYIPPPTVSVVSARRLLTDEDCTADIIGQLASVEAGLLEALDGDAIVRYKFMGTGPYSLCSEMWPPPLPAEEKTVTPLGRQIVAAFSEGEEEEEDVTEEAVEFAGPDGSGEFPPKLAKKRGWRKLVINYADDSEKTVVFQ